MKVCNRTIEVPCITFEKGIQVKKLNEYSTVLLYVSLVTVERRQNRFQNRCHRYRMKKHSVQSKPLQI